MSDWTVDEAEIPNNEERYDMTLDKIGMANVGPKEQQERRVVIKAIIDNGEYEGKRVSTMLKPQAIAQKSTRWQAFVEQLDRKPLSTAMRLKEFIEPIKENEKEVRFSALVHIVEFENESKRGVRYHLSEFQDPEDEAELHIRKEPTQFQRNV